MTRGSSVTSPAPAPSAAATTIATAVSSATTGTLYLGTRLIDIQRSATNLTVVQRRDCLVAFLGIGHLDESETAGTSCIAVSHNAHAIDLSISCEQLTQVIF